MTRSKPLIFLWWVIGGTLAGHSTFAQAQPPAKKTPGGVLIEPNVFPQGLPLSPRALVQRPAAIKGLRGWTVETKFHRGAITAAAASPDGNRVATGSIDGVVRVWDAKTGDLSRALVGHGGYVYGLAWSPDGKTLASAGAFDGTARLWDPDTGQTIRVLKGHKGYTQHVAWSPDGKTLAVAGGLSGFVTAWDVGKPNPTYTVELGNPLTGLAWSPDGKTIGVTGLKVSATLLVAEVGATMKVLPLPGNDGQAIAFSPDGKSVAASGKDKTLVWAMTNLDTPTHTLPAYSGSLAFDPATKALTAALNTQAGVITPDFSKVDYTVQAECQRVFWDAAGKKLFCVGPATVAAFEPGGKPAGPAFPVAAAFDTHVWPGRPVMSGLGGSGPKLWDPATGKAVATLEGHTGSVAAADWSRDGKHLVTGGADKTLRVWDAATGYKPGAKCEAGAVRCVAVAPDGKRVAAGCEKQVAIWAMGGDPPKTYDGHSDVVTAVGWSKDGKLASGGADQKVIVWEGGKASKTFDLVSPASAVAWSGDGRTVAVGCAGGQVYLFNAATGKPGHMWERTGDPPGISGLAWSSDGVSLAAARANHTIQVWNVKTFKSAHETGVLAPPSGISWSTGSALLAVGCSNRTVRYVEAATGLLRGTFVVSPDQSHAVTIATTGNYRAAEEPPTEVIFVAQTDLGQDTLTPKAFADKYKWKNTPGAVTVGK